MRASRRGWSTTTPTATGTTRSDHGSRGCSRSTSPTPRLARLNLSTLTPNPPWAGWMEEVHQSLSDDGTQVAFGAEPNAGRHFKVDLAVVDTEDGAVVRTLIEADVHHGAMAWSPDGSTIAVAATEIGAPDRPARFRLRLVDAGTGAMRELAPEWGGPRAGSGLDPRRTGPPGDRR